MWCWAVGSHLSTMETPPQSQPLRLLYPQTAVLFTPAIVGLLGYTDLSAGFRDRDPLVDVDLGFPQLVQDLVTTTEIYSPSVYVYDLWSQHDNKSTGALRYSEK